MLKHSFPVHHCKLKEKLSNGLPNLHPHASIKSIYLRKIRLWFMVSSEHCNTKYFFRSTGAIKLERRRQYFNSKFYIIHPFSKFHLAYEIVICLLWIFNFFKNPFTEAFNVINTDSNCWSLTEAIVSTFMCLNVVVNFLTGVLLKKTKEIILEPKIIAKHYLLTFFAIDLIGCIPFNYIYHLSYEEESLSKNKKMLCTLSFINILQAFRLNTTISYLRRITFLLGLNLIFHKIICLALVTILFVHWCACVIYAVPFALEHYNTTDTISWLYRAKIEPDRQNVAISERYLQCLLSAFSHFFGTGYDQYEIINYEEVILFSAISVIGMFYTACITAIVLQLIIASTSSVWKYNELLSHLRTYIQKHNLPLSIQKKLFVCVDHRYQKHYYKETAILDTLSEHLRIEIFLCRAKAFVQKVDLLNNIPSSSVGLLLCYIKPEIFLPNDIIWKPSIEHAVYFISYGTVSVFYSAGEVFNFEDGDLIGLIRLFFVHEEIQSSMAVANEISELFKIDKKDLQYCFSKDDGLYKMFKDAAFKRYKEFLSSTHSQKSQDSNADVVYQIRKGRVLEHSYKMRNV